MALPTFGETVHQLKLTNVFFCKKMKSELKGQRKGDFAFSS